MNEIINTNSAAMTAEYTQAITLHRSIITNGTLAAEAYIAFCKDLKEMRDKKLYIHLGYEKFEEYTEQMAGIKYRQAYNYISSYENLGEQFLQSNAQLGISKLVAISQIAPYERDEFMAENDVSELSTRELQAKIDDLNEKCEQLGFEVEEKARAVDELTASKDKLTQLQQDIIAKEAKIKELESRPIDVAVVDEAAIREDLEKEYKKAQKAAIDEAVRKAQKEAEAFQSSILQAKEKDLALIKEKSEKQMEALAKENEALQAELKKPAKTADYKIKLKFYVEQINSNLAECVGLLEEIEDNVEKENVRAGIVKLVDGLRQKFSIDKQK